MDRRRFAASILSALGLSLIGDGKTPAIAQPAAETQPPAGPESDQFAINESFEGEIPDFHTYQATYAADTVRAHIGERSLKVATTKSSGGAYFRLDGVVDLKSDYEFSAWVWVGDSGTARLYISASDGKARYMKAQTAGGRPGEWVQLTGELRGEDWEETDCDVMLAMATTGECWFDDVVLRKTVLPDPPIEIWPALAARLDRAASKRAVTLRPDAELAINARHGVLAPRIADVEPLAPDTESVEIPADGILQFAVDVAEPMYVTGAVTLVPDEDLRPGLRVCILSDDTVIGAPMVKAEPWMGVGNPLTGAAPVCAGERPSDEVQLVEWLVPAGRHTIRIAGPHMRPGGEFKSLRLRALPKPVRPPVYEFALLSDTHLGSGRGTWMNVKMDGPAKGELAATFRALSEEEVDFAIIAGDMTNTATREQFTDLSQVCRESDLPVFGCIGNHDSYLASSRLDALELCAGQFPGGKTDYVLDRPPLRLIVLDGSHWRNKAGEFVDHYDRSDSGGIGIRPEQIEWLRETLAADTETPTVVCWHYPFVSRGGTSNCGYKLPTWAAKGSEVLKVIEAAPNVVATLAGHTHWNELNVGDHITHIVNPAFCEWPNAYRVLRVYDDRVEWELRQVGNRGFVRESFVVPKALTWMISASDDDLTGEFELR